MVMTMLVGLDLALAKVRLKDGLGCRRQEAGATGSHLPNVCHDGLLVDDIFRVSAVKTMSYEATQQYSMLPVIDERDDGQSVSRLEEQ
jgi:hypothetical protein